MHKRKTATLHIDEGTADDMEDKVVSLRKFKRKIVSTLGIDAKNTEVMLDNNNDVSPKNSLSSWKSKKKLATLCINEDKAENMEDKDISIWKSNRKTGKTGNHYVSM